MSIESTASTSATTPPPLPKESSVPALAEKFKRTSQKSSSSSLFSEQVEGAIKGAIEGAIAKPSSNSPLDSPEAEEAEEVCRKLLSGVTQLSEDNKTEITKSINSNKSQGLEFICVKMDTYYRYIDDLYRYIMSEDIRNNQRVKVFFEYISVGERGYISDDLGKMIKFVLMAKCALDLLFYKTDEYVVSLKDDVLDKDFSSEDKSDIRAKIMEIAKI